MKGFYEPSIYRIRLKSNLDGSWTDWFEGMEIRHEENSTVLEGEIADSAALHALLNRINSMNLTIISLENLHSDNQEINHNE